MPLNYTMPVLVVDDTPAMAEIIAAVVKRAGFKNIEQVASGSEAMRRIEKMRHGLVISDLEMEGVDGLQLLKWLRQKEELAGIRFIMITAYKRPDYVVAAANGGADCYLVKPFSPNKLKDKIRQVCLQT